MRIRINPVYGKELKMKVRSVKFALTIFLFNMMLGIVAITGFEVMFNMHLNPYVDYSGAAKVFYILVSMEILTVMFLIPSFTAGSIAGEREKQTLDILLTTTLTPGEIIMGKLMSSISMVFLLVVSSLPIISIVFTIGGIGMEDMLMFMLEILIMLKKTVQATVCSFAQIVLVCGGTVVVVIVAYIAAKLYYYNCMGAVGSMPDVSSVLFILLINPAFTIVQMTAKHCESISVISKAAGMLNGSMPSTIVDNWFRLSMISQMIVTVILLRISAILLKPTRKKKTVS